MRLLRILITVALPIILVMLNVRLIMSPLWLQIEYTRPGFPADPFGFTTEDRLTYAPYAVDYLVYQHDIAYLGNLRFPDGRPLYNERELIHMRDVQAVTGWANIVALAAAALTLSSAFLLWHRSKRDELLRGVWHGAILTIVLLAAIIILAIVGWEFFFTGFHQLFFADGTWYFLTSDTLIRLFPEQFWFDAALVIGGLTLLQALVIALLTRPRLAKAAL
jgi:integral membrane protein (TIGR01906 family)